MRAIFRLIRLIPEQIVYGILDRAAELDVDDLFLRLGAARQRAFENALQLVTGPARQHLDQPDVGLFVERHHQQPVLADQAGIDALMHALLQNPAEVALAQNLGDLARGGERARQQRPQRDDVTLTRLLMRRDHLPTLIQQQRMTGAGILRQLLQQARDGLLLALRHDDIGELLHAALHNASTHLPAPDNIPAPQRSHRGIAEQSLMARLASLYALEGRDAMANPLFGCSGASLARGKSRPVWLRD